MVNLEDRFKKKRNVPSWVFNVFLIAAIIISVRYVYTWSNVKVGREFVHPAEIAEYYDKNPLYYPHLNTTNGKDEDFLTYKDIYVEGTGLSHKAFETLRAMYEYDHPVLGKIKRALPRWSDTNRAYVVSATITTISLFLAALYISGKERMRFGIKVRKNAAIAIAAAKRRSNAVKPSGVSAESSAKRIPEKPSLKEPAKTCSTAVERMTPVPVKAPSNVKTFSDIAGYEKTKSNMEFIVRCIKDRALLNKAGAKIPKGVLLYGPPGTGKTLMASAIAGSAGVPFFSVNASSFINTFVGTGAASVRELYAKAKAHAPSVVFIDELDAVGGRRNSSQNSEYRSTINALLSEIDGMDSSYEIITIAATNSIETLDDALIRPGRFDRRIFVPLPSLADREKIIALHAKNKTLKGITIEEIAKSTEGFSGAALATLLNEAAIKAASSGRSCITKEDINESLFMLVTGSEELEAISDPHALQTAYHEAGHAIVMKMLEGKTIPRVSINAATSGLVGSTINSGSSEGLLSRKQLENEIKGMYGGRAAEEIFLGGTDDISAGSFQDLKVATRLIKLYLSEFGMGDSLIAAEELFGRSVLSNDFAEKAAKLSDRLYIETIDFLKLHKNQLDALAGDLYEKKSITDEDVARVCGI